MPDLTTLAEVRRPTRAHLLETRAILALSGVRR
jgi:hypothetical protein